MATKAKSPGIPRKPDTADVAKLIGTWIPKLFPATFKKNKNNAPMTNLIAACPINLAGLNGAPENNNSSTSTAKTEITIIGSKKAIPLQIILLTTYVQVIENRPV
jgi:hypothetical protein